VSLPLRFALPRWGNYSRPGPAPLSLRLAQLVGTVDSPVLCALLLAAGETPHAKAARTWLLCAASVDMEMYSYFVRIYVDFSFLVPDKAFLDGKFLNFIKDSAQAANGWLNSYLVFSTKR